MLHEARYGVSRSDPYRALRDDGVAVEEPFDDASVARAFQSQFAQLERLVRAHKKSHERSKMVGSSSAPRGSLKVLSVTERTHRRALEQLEAERQRASLDAAQGDDVVARVQRQSERLEQQVCPGSW